MQQKVDSAAWAWRAGTAVVIANGMRQNIIRDICDGKKVCAACVGDLWDCSSGRDGG